MSFQIEQSSPISGYLIFAGLFSALFGYLMQDALYFGFAIFIFAALALSASIDAGDVSHDLAKVGWSATNINMSIPLGILGGIITIVLGSFIISIDLMHILIPDLSTLAKFFTTASIIPPTLAVSANIIAQIMVVAPGEEALKMILAPFGAKAIFKNTIFAFVIGMVFWVVMHVPTFTSQNAPQSMYLVLFLLGIIGIILFFITQSILAPILAHITFNVGVILNTASGDTLALFTIVGVVLVLFYIYAKNQKVSYAK